SPVSGTIGIVHPLELDAGARQAWRQHLADYEITPPFPQLERPVIAPTPEQAARKFLADTKGTQLYAMTFRGRAEKRGWVRGSVCENGAVTGYYKPFPAAAVDAFVQLEGMYVGDDSSVTLHTFYFVRHGSVRVGSYTYDEPANESDPRLVTAADVPPIVFSEALGDLRHIAGRNVDAAT
ncbi:MAG: DUF4132 domain-containing protein, partial [Verrucomicrobiota bacterium]|nr:DUF4132 domain-containing protein [Verrucomicrobiota bacterium]